MRKIRVMCFIAITIATLIIPTAVQVTATSWSDSSAVVVNFESQTLGNSKGLKDNGQIGGYKTWSAWVSGGWWNWGEVRVWVTSANIKTDDWAGLYQVDFSTYFDGKITRNVDNQNIFLQITYKLKQASSTIFQTVVEYSSTYEWTGTTITKTVFSLLSANKDYNAYVYYRYYCGVSVALNKIDFWQHSTQYHQWRGWSLSHD